MVLCDPYGSRARRSERNRHMRVGAGLRSNEKVDCLRQGTPRRGKSLYVASASAMADAEATQRLFPRRGVHAVGYCARLCDSGTSFSAKYSAPISLLDFGLHRACALLEAQPRRSEMEMKTSSCMGHTLTAPWNTIRKHPPRSSERSEHVSLRKANGRRICHG